VLYPYGTVYLIMYCSFCRNG